MSSIMENFFTKSNMGVEQKIVEELLNSTSNLDTKTALNKPLRWSCLSIVQGYLNDKKLVQSSNILKNFVECSFRYLISQDRLGRKEYIEALQALAEKNNQTPPQPAGKL